MTNSTSNTVDTSTHETIDEFRSRVIAFHESVPNLIDGIDDALERGKTYRRALCDARLAAVSYPIELGGANLPGEYEAAGREAALDLLPGEDSMFTLGVGMAVPTLREYGTPALQQRFIPAALRGDEVWCQLYSEPGAGSDLAGSDDARRTRWRRVDHHRPKGVDVAGPTQRHGNLAGPY